MWVIVYCNEGMDSGMVYLCRKLRGSEILNERRFADEVAAQWDRTIAEPDGYIPNCSGDLRVEFLDYKPRTEHDAYRGYDRFLGATRIWSGASFYFETEC